MREHCITHTHTPLASGLVSDYRNDPSAQCFNFSLNGGTLQPRSAWAYFRLGEYNVQLTRRLTCMFTRKGLLICCCTSYAVSFANNWNPRKNLIVPHIRMKKKETGISTNFSSTAKGGGSTWYTPLRFCIVRHTTLCKCTSQALRMRSGLMLTTHMNPSHDACMTLQFLTYNTVELHSTALHRSLAISHNDCAPH